MKRERVGLSYKGKKIFIEVRKIVGLIGFMFTNRDNADAVVFNFNKKFNLGLHSWFVFFPFLVVWLDNKNRIVEMKIMRPFSSYFAPQKNVSKVVEIPLNQKYKKIVEKMKKLVGKERFK